MSGCVRCGSPTTRRLCKDCDLGQMYSGENQPTLPETEADDD